MSSGLGAESQLLVGRVSGVLSTLAGWHSPPHLPWGKSRDIHPPSPPLLLWARVLQGRHCLCWGSG